MDKHRKLSHILYKWTVSFAIWYMSLSFCCKSRYSSATLVVVILNCEILLVRFLVFSIIIHIIYVRSWWIAGMLLEFQGEHPNDEGLCSSQQRKSVAALCLVIVLLTGLLLVARSQFLINKQLTNSDLNYENGRYFGVLADIHIDQYQNDTHCRNGDDLEGEWIVHSPTPYGANLCDSSSTLLNMTIREFKEIEDKTGPFEFILIIGDQVGHWIEGIEPSIGSVNKIRNLVSSYFPSTPVYFVLGNHDLTTLHYEIPENVERWYSMISTSLFPGLYTTESQLLSATKTFNKHGFYKVEHSSSLWVVALNTNTFSYNIHDATEEDIGSQFDWLNETLHQAENQKSVSVLLFGHIPPEIEFLDLARWDSNKNMTWKPDCVTRFNDIVGRFSSIIKLSFFAHQHTDNWYAGKSPNGGHINHFLMPPVSPVSRGHPSFSVGVANEGWDLLDLLYYHSPVEQLTRTDQTPRYFYQYSFKEQNFHFNEKYSAIDAALMDGLTKRIVDFEDGMETYTARLMNTYQFRYKPHVSAYEMYCVMTENTSEGLDACLKK